MTRIQISVLACLLAIATSHAATLYVSPTGGNQYPYMTWGSAALSIQDAVNAASDGDTVLIGDGTYPLTTEIVVAKGITVRGANGAAAAIIDGQKMTRCLKLTHAQAVLDGLTVRNGHAATEGGGVSLANATVRNCVIISNEVDGYQTTTNTSSIQTTPVGVGGGAYSIGGTVQGCVVAWNKASLAGAGVFCRGGVVLDSRLEFNDAFGQAGSYVLDASGRGTSGPYGWGGGVYLQDAVLERSRVVGNVASYIGGGVAMSNGVVRACAISSNIARGYSYDPLMTMQSEGRVGGVWGYGVVDNCTILYNTANLWPHSADYGMAGGVCLESGELRNSIVHSNRLTHNDLLVNSSVGGSTVSYCATKSPDYAGSGNFTNDPMLEADLTLKNTSPCIDAGADSGASSLDLNWKARWDHPGHPDKPSIVDIGAFEYNIPGDWLVQPLGNRPVITMGTVWGSGLGFSPVPGDYNGDGTNDLAAYANETGHWYIRKVGNGPPITFGQQWGGAGLMPVYGDYNGDGLDDLAVYDIAAGNWYIRSLGPGSPICFGQNWGGTGCLSVEGDYNGDGVSDLAVYHVQSGNWFIRSLGKGNPICFGMNWGGPGLTPVPGDYDHDGKWDLAVHDTATGNWFIRSLVKQNPICFGQNWGAGLVPVEGDYNGDGLYDLACYQLSTGNWYIRSLGPIGPGNPPICFGQHWGAADCLPVPGDYNGDGLDDLAIYHF